MLRSLTVLSMLMATSWAGFAAFGHDGGSGYSNHVEHGAHYGGGHEYAGGFAHGGGLEHGGGYGGGYGGGHGGHYEHVPIGYDGVPLDTPEIEHAKAEHFRAHEEAKSRLHTGLTYKDLPVDTHEVAVAKVAHAHAHAVVKARNANIAAQHAYAGQQEHYGGGFHQEYHH